MGGSYIPPNLFMLDTSTLDKRFRKLFQDGKLVQVHVSKWSMSHQLSKSDLGLEKDKDVAIENEVTVEEKPKEIPDFIMLGKKWLFTDDVRLQFSRIEAAARKYLADNSHRFPIADAHFVPQKSLVRVITTLEKYKNEYEKATAAFIENYDANKQKMFEKYPDHRKLLEPYYPSVADIRSKFSYSISIFEVAFPRNLKSVSMEDIMAQNIAVEEARKKYETQMDEQYKHSLKQMEVFVAESALALRKEVIATFETIAEKIKNKEVVNSTNIKSIRSVIESFDSLDFFDDKKVKDSLNVVKKLVTSGANFKEEEDLERLSTAINSTLETAKTMTDIDALTGGYIRRLDIDDEL